MADLFDRLTACIGFEWDENNAEKNWITHQVLWTEAEEILFNEPLIAAADVRHSASEPRFFVLGHTDAGRYLFLVFTIRDYLIRVISVRDMSRRERQVYQDVQSQVTTSQEEDPEV